MQKTSIDGLKEGEFDHLAEEDKKKILMVMSRIMERAYRRGVQQALHLSQQESVLSVITSDLHVYRYETSIETSYGLDGFKTSSMERLFMEESLELIGFEQP